MGWDDWSYAKKGGAIFISLHILLSSLFFLIFYGIIKIPDYLAVYFGIITLPSIGIIMGLYLLLYHILGSFSVFNCSTVNGGLITGVNCPVGLDIFFGTLIALGSLLIFFGAGVLIGKFIGWIIGIIKKNKNDK